MWFLDHINTLSRTSEEKVPLYICHTGQFTPQVVGVNSSNITNIKTLGDNRSVVVHDGGKEGDKGMG